MQRTALVAAYVNAIERARKNGWTWNEVLSVIPDDVASTREQLRHAYLRAVRRINKGNLDPDQIPLPQAGPSSLASKEAQTNAQSSSSSQKPVPTDSGQSTQQNNDDPLGIFGRDNPS